jgi:hypothetical protein
MSELLKRARQLCYREGEAWSLDDFESGVTGVSMLTVIADEKNGYLNRAREMLKRNSR